MAENTIFVKKYTTEEIPAMRESELWRYAGYGNGHEEIDKPLLKVKDEVLSQLQDAFSYKVCYRRMELPWNGSEPVLPFDRKSKDLAKCLEGATEIVLFAATIGLEIDRYIARFQRISPTKALLAQAYGAERIEALCDYFCGQWEESLRKEGLSVSPRFSPGYGDLPLEAQRDFFALLDCNRQVGISLNSSLLMTPSKSVTAIFGVGSCVGTKRREHKCESCPKKDCEYRRITS